MEKEGDDFEGEDDEAKVPSHQYLQSAAHCLPEQLALPRRSSMHQCQTTANSRRQLHVHKAALYNPKGQ